MQCRTASREASKARRGSSKCFQGPPCRSFPFADALLEVIIDSTWIDGEQTLASGRQAVHFAIVVVANTHTNGEDDVLFRHPALSELKDESGCCRSPEQRTVYFDLFAIPEGQPDSGCFAIEEKNLEQLLFLLIVIGVALPSCANGFQRTDLVEHVLPAAKISC